MRNRRKDRERTEESKGGGAEHRILFAELAEYNKDFSCLIITNNLHPNNLHVEQDDVASTNFHPLKCALLNKKM